MAIKIGTISITDVGKIKLGSTNITKVYQGVNQIWPATVTSYSYTVKLSETLGNVCTATPVTIYSESSTWSTFMGLYSDAGLTTFITGFNYVVQSVNNDIYSIDHNVETLDSFLGTDTGNNCS